MSDRVSRFEDLIAWQKARGLVGSIHRVARSGTFGRDFVMSNQIRSAALSIPSNIAEGFERGRRAEFHQFPLVAKASCAEARSQLYSALDVGHINHETFNALTEQTNEVARIIGGLRKSLTRVPHSVLSTQYSALRKGPCSPKI